MEIKVKRDRAAGAYVGGAVLIVLGVVALIGNLAGSEIFYKSIPLGIGVAFFVAYILTRQYGFLVPAGILTGVGAGVLASSVFNVADNGAYAAIGGGFGFLAIFVIDYLVSGSAARWWPTIPGGLMVVIGASGAPANDVFVRALQVAAPLLLIAIGAVILLSRLRRPT